MNNPLKLSFELAHNIKFIVNVEPYKEKIKHILKERKDINYPNDLNLFEIEIDYIILRQDDDDSIRYKNFENLLQEVATKIKSIFYSNPTIFNSLFSFIIDTKRNKTLQYFFVSNGWNVIEFDTAVKGEWIISPLSFSVRTEEKISLRETKKKTKTSSPSLFKIEEKTPKESSSLSCPWINILNALHKWVEWDKTDRSIQLFDLKNQQELKMYFQYLEKNIGFSLFPDEKRNLSLKNTFFEKKYELKEKQKTDSFTFLHLFTFFQEYEQILVIEWKKEKFFIFFGIFPSVGNIKKKEFSLRSNQPKECLEKGEILTIVCDPKDLDLAAQFCVTTLQATGLDLVVFYFYPFEDGPNDNLLESFMQEKQQQQQIQKKRPLLSSYTIYTALVETGFFHNIAKYNKYGILQFTSKYEQAKNLQIRTPYEWFNFEIKSVEKVLGEGSYGCTLFVELEENENEKTGQKAVVKIVSVESKRQENEIIYETDLHDLIDTLNLPHIPTFIGAQKYNSFSELEETVSEEELNQKCPKITSKLMKTKYPIYTIAMSAAIGGSFDTLYSTSNLSSEIIKSLAFQGIYTLEMLEKFFGFFHRDLNENNILFIKLDEKNQTYWKYEYQKEKEKENKNGETSWIVPIELILQFIDFGLSGTEKTNNPFYQAGTWGFVHPLYTLDVMDFHPWKWTVDWYAFGKHIFNLAIRQNVAGEIDYWLEDNTIIENLFKKTKKKKSKSTREKKINEEENEEDEEDEESEESEEEDDEENEQFIEWIGEILFLDMLGHKLNEEEIKKLQVMPVWENIVLSPVFFDSIKELSEKLVLPHLLPLVARAKERIGENGIELIRNLCQWNYVETSGFYLLNHSYFNDFKFEYQKNKIPQVTKTISK